MLSKLGRSRSGVATIIAEVMMVLIVILLSAIVYVWVVPALTSQASKDNAGAAYSEKFETVRAQFATYVVSIPETVAACGSQDTSVGCAPSSYLTCGGSITSTYTGNVLVPANGVCLITATATVNGNVYVYSGGNLTVIGGTINGGLEADSALSVTLQNAKVSGFTGLYNVQTVNISGSALNTSGQSICTDACGGALYAGGRGFFSMTNTNVTGQVENEVGHNTIVNNNHITGRLEIESADLGQIINNVVGSLDLDQNGTIVIAGNIVNGTAKYGTNGWCGTGNNQISGSTTGTCIGNVEVDVRNTGAATVKFVAVYMTNIPLAGVPSWQLASGNPTQCGNALLATCNQLPIVIPVGDMAEITMDWTAPSGAFPLQ